MLSPNARARTSISGSLSEGEAPQPTLTDIRRKRKTQSCLVCRRRKVRCDREYPSCNRCRKSGDASSCSYDERPRQRRPTERSEPSARRSPKLSIAPSTPRVPSPSGWTSSDPVAHLRQTNRIENRPSAAEASQTSETWQLLGRVVSTTEASERRHYVKATQESTPPETIIFRGKNFKTQYYGSSNPTSIIPYFPELHLFMKETIKRHSSLPRVQRDLKALQMRWKAARTNVLPLTDLELLHLLPNRETMDYLVHLYFDSFETTYRILHRPSFWKEYHVFWESRPAANPAFVIVMLLMMAAVSCLSLNEQPKYIGDSAIARERAVLWIEVSEWWLRSHSQKHIYLAIWQIRCLLVLAKQVNAVKKKQSWIAAGNLVREAMSAGFHRDPSLLEGKVSAFDQEMRRRLWATMVEMELQASIDRGMPSATAGIPSDCATVLNIDDEDLAVECDNLPKSKPWREYTACSFLHISRASFYLRVSLNSLGNDLSSPLLYNEVLNYEELISKELEKLPQRAGQPEPGENKDIRGLPVIVRTLLDLQLRQFLLLLYTPFARQADTNSPRFSLSMMNCFNAAASMIEQHSQLANSGNLTLLLLRHDCIRGALAICHNIFISNNIQNNFFFNSNSKTFIQYVENALTMLGDRIARLGTGHTHYWYISAAHTFIRSKISSQESIAPKQQAIDRVMRQYYHILASQEDLAKAKEIIIPVHLSKINTTGDQIEMSDLLTSAPGLSYPNPSVSQYPFEHEDMSSDEFYFGNPSAWTFNNLWAIE